MSIKVAKILAEKIIKEMENGTIPWDKCFTDPTLPYNPTTDKSYHGFNAFSLLVESLMQKDNRFLGLKQAQKIGGKLKEGEYYKGVPIYCPIFKKIKGEDGTENQRLVSFCFSNVYSVGQFEGINPSKIKTRDIKRINNPIQAAEDFIGIQNPAIVSGVCPCYIPSLDRINMPDRNNYISSDHYYSTLMHEIGHWTGNKDRMNRVGVVDSIRFGTEKYGKEELIAEMFSFFSRHHLGLESEPDNPERKNRVSYLKGWIEKLKAEPQILFSAAAEAERAMNWYLGEESIERIEEETEEVA